MLREFYAVDDLKFHLDRALQILVKHLHLFLDFYNLIKMILVYQKINTKSYNMKENGKIRFSLDEAAKVSEVLKLSLNEVNNIFLQIKLPKGNKFRR